MSPPSGCSFTTRISPPGAHQRLGEDNDRPPFPRYNSLAAHPVTEIQFSRQFPLEAARSVSPRLFQPFPTRIPHRSIGGNVTLSASGDRRLLTHLFTPFSRPSNRVCKSTPNIRPFNFPSRPRSDQFFFLLPLIALLLFSARFTGPPRRRLVGRRADNPLYERSGGSDLPCKPPPGSHNLC